jgi:AP-3 complex subunit beta
MVDLGSVGSGDARTDTDASIDLSNPEDVLQDPRAVAFETVYALIGSQQKGAHTTAMKMLMALMSKGHNVSEFSPFVIQQLVSTDPLARQLAYVFLNHFAQDDPETAMLAINTFQRSLTDSDPMRRASAVKSLSSIALKDALPAIQDAIIQVIGDASPYVKKAAAFAMIKACELEPGEIDTYLPHLERLLGDSSPIAFSGAIAAYWSLCPDNIEFLHHRFKWMCHNITKFDSYAQVFILRAFTVYCRYCFKNPEGDAADDGAEAFWIEETSHDVMTSDHLALIHAAKRLLQSPTAAVVLAAVAFLFYCAPAQHVNSIAKPLVRLLYETPTTAELSLITIQTIATQYQHVFLPHMSHFYIKKSDPLSVKQLKMRVLSILVTEGNAEQVLAEFAGYAGSNDREFAASAVKTMGKTALMNESIIPVCLLSLLKLLGRADGQVMTEVVVVIAHLLRRRRGTDDEAYALRILCRRFVAIKQGTARAAVLSIVGDMHETHPDFAPELLRYVAQNFGDEAGEVRLQSLTLAAKLIALGSESQVPLYLLKVCERDTEFDVRDRARFLLALLENGNQKIQSRLRELLFPPRKPPNWSAMDRSSNNYQIGTFSQLFDRALGGYEPLPDWAPEEELPDSSVRNVSADGKQIVVNDEGETGEEQEDGRVLDFDDFFKEDGEAASEEEAAEEEAAEYYSDEAPEGEYEAPGKAKPTPSADQEEDADEGTPQDDELDDFFD